MSAGGSSGGCGGVVGGGVGRGCLGVGHDDVCRLHTAADDAPPGPHYHERFIIPLLVHNGNDSSEGSGLATAHQLADGPAQREMRSEAALLPANPSPPLTSPGQDSLQNAPPPHPLRSSPQHVSFVFYCLDFTLLDIVEIQIGIFRKGVSMQQNSQLQGRLCLPVWGSRFSFLRILLQLFTSVEKRQHRKPKEKYIKEQLKLLVV